MIKKFVVFLWLIIGSLQVMAQKNITGKISGRVLDSSTRKSIEYATITLTDKTGKTISGAVTDSRGNFQLTQLKAGAYILITDFIGYQQAKNKDVTITETQPNVFLGNILLHTSSTTLADVTVSSRAPLIENKIDKIVFNAANDVTSQGGVALDVLKKVPQVSVDINGNVELQGNPSIRFLINGKPSSVFGNNLADVLASIPASQIKSIEAITSPGARYDAQGTGGIINIILKDSRVQGMNGSVNLSAGSRLENGAINLNFRRNKFGLNAHFSGNAQLSSHTPTSYTRLSTDTRLQQDGYSDFERNGFETGIGFDWSPTKKDNFSGSFGFDHFSNTNRGITNQEQYAKNGTVITDIFSTRDYYSHSGTHAFDWNLNYKKKFKQEGRELELQYNSSFGVPNSSYTQSQVYAGQSSPYLGSRSDNPGNDNETEIALDYVHPVSEGFELETGLKTAQQTINSIADVFTLNASSGSYLKDNAQSYQLHYHRGVYAAYASGSFSLGKALDIKAGLRLEHTDTKIDFPGTVIPSYNTYAPSIVLSHKLENGMIKLAYTHRIERPDYREVNPFVNLADPYNITTGNPLLQPELGNNFELGFSKTFGEGGNIYIALVSRFNSQDIKPYTQFYPSYKIGDSIYYNVSVSTRLNIGLENRTGINISGSIPVTRSFTLRTNMFLSNRHVVNQLAANTVTDGFDGRMNVNATLLLPRNLALESFVNYNTSVNNIQGKQPQFLAYTFAFRKFFLNKKMSVGFTATNAFSKYIKQVTTIASSGYNSYSLRQVPYRSFGISLSYKFGKLEFKKVKEEDNSFINNPQGNQ